MNSKKAINSQLSTTESKNKLSKQPEQKENHKYGDHLEGYQLGEAKGRMGGKGAGVKKHKIDRELRTM